MATTALGIAPLSDGTGCDPLTHRRIIAGRWASVGVVCGLVVTGRSDLSYEVSAGCAVASRSESDGYVELYFEGGTVATEANPSSSPRIDVVWVKANDAQQGDEDNSVVVGVTQGTPSASPVAPSAPAGCTVLSEHMVPAGATSTSAVTLNAEGYRAIPYGASLGILVDAVDTSNDEVTDSYVAAAGTVNLPTDRVLSLKVTITMCSLEGSWTDDDGSVYCHLRVDGKDVDSRELRLRGGAENAVSNYYERVVQVAEGTHQVSLYLSPGESKTMKRYWSADGWAGQCLQVVDVCPAA